MEGFTEIYDNFIDSRVSAEHFLKVKAWRPENGNKSQEGTKESLIGEEVKSFSSQIK